MDNLHLDLRPQSECLREICICTVSGHLRDADEVFHCEITDEIFKDYEEYCERIILVNSMVWTCEMTGKTNLAYSEELTHEKAALPPVKKFFNGAANTAEISEDIFNFLRDRFFVGETVEACLDGDNWSKARKLSVTAQKQHPGSKPMIPSSSYCYEVEQFDDSGAAQGQIGQITVSFDRVRVRVS